MGSLRPPLELTSPAGNPEKGKFALHYGADSIYIGFPGFSLRAGAEKFDSEDLKKLLSFAREKEKKVYFALNIFAHNAHLRIFDGILEEVQNLKPDGLILADPGLLYRARKKLPDMHLTISTQANLTNYETIRFWEESLGINRVVLARELAIDEIREIRRHTRLELEVFVHGAVCMAYSGRCLLSGFMTAPEGGMTHQKFGSDRVRHANLGDCVQPCRFRFALVEENRRDLAFPIEEDQWGTYILSAKDLCLVDYLKELRDAGVNVFKIEGRMKSIYYVANVTRVYRKALDLLEKDLRLDPEEKKELERVSHREYSAGFTFPKPGSTAVTHQGYQKSYRFHATIEEDKTAPFYSLKVFNSFDDTRTLEVIGPDMKKITLKPREYRLLDRERNSVSRVRHPFDGFLQTSLPLKKYDILRIAV